MRIESTTLATAAVTVSTNACTITKIQGLKVAANDRFLQLHDTKATPSAAAVPVRVWPIYGTAPFGEAFVNLPVAMMYGATFVVSSTANTYTASAETVDITVDGVSTFDTTGVTTAGDYTSGLSNAELWATTAGGHQLLRLEFTALTAYGATLYAKIFATSSPVAGQKPLATIVLPNNTSVDRGFNLHPFQFISQAAVEACYVAIDATAGGYDGTYSGTDYAIKVTYK